VRCIVKRSTGHTHTHRQRTTPPTLTHTHTHTTRTNPQTNTSHKHLTATLDGATTVCATSHARVGGRAKVSVRGRVEVRRGLGRARVRNVKHGLWQGACYRDQKAENLPPHKNVSTHTHTYIRRDAHIVSGSLN